MNGALLTSHGKIGSPVWVAFARRLPADPALVERWRVGDPRKPESTLHPGPGRMTS